MDLMDASYIGYLVICGIIGIVGNAIIIRVIQKKKPKLSTDILIIALAAVDLMSSALLIPAITWSISLDFRTRFNCVFFWYFRRTFACESALLASIIAIDRYIMVCSPCKLTTSKRKAMIWVVLSNVFCLFICLQFVAYGNAVGVGESIVCVYKGPGWLQLAFGMILNFIYLLACVSCSFCYSMIYRKIKKHNDNTAYMQSAINSGTAVTSKDAGNSGSAPVEAETANVGTDNSQGGGHASGNGNQSDLQECLSESMESNHAPPKRMTFSDNAQPILAISSAVHNKESSKKQVLRSHLVVKNQVSPASKATNGATSGQAHNSKPRPKKDKMTKMMFIVTIIYVISVFPVLTLENLPTRYVTRLQQLPLGVGTVNFLYQMRLINHIINIFVYYGVNEHFRSQTNALLGVRCSRNRIIV